MRSISKTSKALFLILLIFSVSSIYSPIQDAEALTVWKINSNGTPANTMYHFNNVTAIPIPVTNTNISIQLRANFSTGTYANIGARYNPFQINYCAGKFVKYTAAQEPGGGVCNKPNNQQIVTAWYVQNGGSQSFNIQVLRNGITIGAFTGCGFTWADNIYHNYTAFVWNNATGLGARTYVDGVQICAFSTHNTTITASSIDVIGMADLSTTSGNSIANVEIESLKILVNTVTKFSYNFALTCPDIWGQFLNAYTCTKTFKGADTFFVPTGHPGTLAINEIGNITTRILYRAQNNSVYSLSSAHLTLWASSNAGINYNNYSALYTDINGHILFQFIATETPTIGYYQFFIQYPGNVSGSTGYRGLNSSIFTIGIGTFLILSDPFNLFDLVEINPVGFSGILIQAQEFFNFLDRVIVNPQGSGIIRIIIDQLNTRDSIRIFLGLLPTIPPNIPPVYGPPNINNNSPLNFIITAIALPMLFLFAIIFIVLIKFKTQTGTTEMVLLPFVLLGINALAWTNIIPSWIILIEVIFLGAAITVIVRNTFAKGD